MNRKPATLKSLDLRVSEDLYSELISAPDTLGSTPYLLRVVIHNSNESMDYVEVWHRATLEWKVLYSYPSMQDRISCQATQDKQVEQYRRIGQRLLDIAEQLISPGVKWSFERIEK